MELMQLQMLVAVAEEGNLPRAAERVHRTAPALSIAISKLERELDVVLFDRSSNRDFRLTEAGEVLLDYARRLVSLKNEALAAVEELRYVKGGHLRIGANESIGDYVLPQVTKAFQARHPGVKLAVTIGHSDALVSSLKRRELDIALVGYKPQSNELDVQPFMRDTLVAILKPGHRLAIQEVIRIEELAEESLIIEKAASSLREKITGAFEHFRIPLSPKVETETIESIKKMVENDMGVGIVPRICVKKEEVSGELIAKPIEEFRDERTLWAVRRRGAAPSPACQAFMKVIEPHELWSSEDPDAK